MNVANGAQIWNYTTGNVIDSSAVVVDGVIYIGSWDSNVYGFNATSGAKLWNYPTGGAVVSSAAVVNGIVYVGSNDHVVYALGALSTLTVSPRPAPTATASPASLSPSVPEFSNQFVMLLLGCMITTLFAVAITLKRTSKKLKKSNSKLESTAKSEENYSFYMELKKIIVNYLLT